MAEAFARHHGAGVILPASAGLSAAGAIARDTVQVMQEKGISLTDQFPKDFEVALAETYEIVINISGFSLPPLKKPVIVEWDIMDPNGARIETHRLIRDQIEERVSTLISDLRDHGTVVNHDAVGQQIAPETSRKSWLWQRFTRRR
jgi:arsenate reductase